MKPRRKAIPASCIYKTPAYKSSHLNNCTLAASFKRRLIKPTANYDASVILVIYG